MSASSFSRPLRALVLQKEDATPVGLVGRWLDERGAEVREHRIEDRKSVV